jgi:hypothetical protein
MRAVDRGLREIGGWLRFCRQWNEPHPARPIRGSVIAGRWGKHMFKRFETSAERLDERLDPWQLSRRNPTMRQVTRIRALKAAAATVVHDVQGPIVTGVLGGD